jgi:hypothetical protein
MCTDTSNNYYYYYYYYYYYEEEEEEGETVSMEGAAGEGVKVKCTHNPIIQCTQNQIV